MFSATTSGREGTDFLLFLKGSPQQEAERQPTPYLVDEYGTLTEAFRHYVVGQNLSSELQ